MQLGLPTSNPGIQTLFGSARRGLVKEEPPPASTAAFDTVLTIAGEALCKDAGKAVVSSGIPALVRIQHKKEGVCNLGQVQHSMEVPWVIRKAQVKVEAGML